MMRLQSGKRRLDVIAGATLAVLSLLGIFVLVPAQVPPGAPDMALSPDAMPDIALTGIFVLSIWLVVDRLLVGRGQDQPSSVTARQFVNMAIYAVILLIGFYGFVYIGYLFGGVIVVFFMMLFMGERRPLRIGAVSILAPAALYGFFWGVLGIPLP